MNLESIPIPTGIIFDPEVSRPQLRTYARLRAIAWQNDFRSTKAIDLDQAIAITGLAERQFFNHTGGLKKAKWLAWSHPLPNKIVYTFPLQKNAALINKFKDSLKIENDNLNQLISTAKKCSELLQEHGVNAGIANNIASQYTADEVRKYINHYLWNLADNSKITAGYLVRSIIEQWDIPPNFESEIERCETCGFFNEKHSPGCQMAYVSGKYAEFLNH